MTKLTINVRLVYEVEGDVDPSTVAEWISENIERRDGVILEMELDPREDFGLTYQSAEVLKCEETDEKEDD